MPTPYVPQTVTITDYFEDGSGNPLDGRCEFRPSVVSKTPGGTIARHPVTAKITGGNLAVVLIAPDSTGVTPQNWTYDVRLTLGPPGSAGAEGIDAFTVEAWSIRPVAANPAVVLRDLTPVDPVPASAFDVRSVAGVLPDVGGNVALTAADLELAGIGFVAESTFTAFTATKAQPSGLASLDSSGYVPVAQLPPIALSEYLGSVASQAAMLALTGQRGDWCIRTDTSSTGSVWVLNAEPSSTLGNWTQLPVPAVPVTSVAGKTGAVTLVKADVGLSNVDNTADTAKPVSTAQATAIALKLDASQKAAASGVASLDSGTKVPIAQIPTGSSSSTVAIGNDARLSDARTPLAHSHVIADVTGLSSSLDVLGYVGEHFPTSAVTGSGTTEKVGCFVTFSAVAGRRYKATWGASLFSQNTNTNANLITNPFAIKLRYKATSSSTDVTGTVFDGTERGGLSDAYYTPVSLSSEFVAPTTATYTVVATFNPTTSAAGNVTQAYVAGTHLPKLFVECIKGP